MKLNQKISGIILVLFLIAIILLAGCVRQSESTPPSYEILEIKCVEGSSMQTSYGFSAIEGVIQNTGANTIESLSLRLSLYNRDNARVGYGISSVKNIRPNERIKFQGSVSGLDNLDDCLNGNATIIARFYPGMPSGTDITKPTHGNIEVFNTHCASGRYGPEIRSYIKNLDSTKHETIVVKYYIYDESRTRIGETRGDINSIEGGETAQVKASLQEKIYQRCQKENLSYEIQTFQFM